MGDVDLWSLNDDSSMITVNSKWLQHLQVSCRVRNRSALSLEPTLKLYGLH